MQYLANEIVCREGDFNNSLFIVKNGQLEGTSLQSNQKRTYGPGSIIGEFSLVENSAITETIQALQDSEIQIISGETFKEALKQEPSWVESIINFLSRRSHIAEEDYQKNQKIKSLPALLYLLSNTVPKSNEPSFNLSEITTRMENLVNLEERLVKDLLSILEELDILKFQTNEVRVKNRNVVELLYQSILHRATKKEASPYILSITDQMVLTAVIKAVQDSSEPLQNGKCIIPTAKLIATAKKTTHGMTLTMRNVLPLLNKNILQCNATEELTFTTPIDAIHCFYGDFDRILDLMELNRIYPLLDKKLV